MILFVTTVLVCILAGLWNYARWYRGTLEKMGIPMVENSHPLLGSARDMYEKVGALSDIAWVKKYGPIFGVYEGREPHVYVAVPELVRLICVKDAEYFNSKRPLNFGDPILNEMPDFQPLEKWRILRSMATPVFTSAKVKMMNLPMREATQEFVGELKQKIKSGKGVHEKIAIDQSIHSMLTDLISRCIFSVKIDHSGGGGGSGSSVEHEFAQIVKELVTPPGDHQNQELIIWAHAFPFMKSYLPAIFKPEPVKKFVGIFKQLIAERKKNGQKMNDTMDLFVEWFDQLDSPEFRKANIKEFSLFCQAFVFFFAAQDQISTMVSSVIYHMIKNPDLEKRIYEEVDRVFAKNNGKVEHEQLNELVLMQSCLQEALRLYTFFHRIERLCTKDWKNEEFNLDVKKGTTIQIPLWALNRSSEYTENAEEFDPDRFLPENKDKLNVFCTTSFGHGPRNCTGMRFSKETMALVLAYLLKDLKFVGRKDTAYDLIAGGPFMQPHNPIYVDVIERSK